MAVLVAAVAVVVGSYCGRHLWFAFAEPLSDFQSCITAGVSRHRCVLSTQVLTPTAAVVSKGVAGLAVFRKLQTARLKPQLCTGSRDPVLLTAPRPAAATAYAWMD